LSEKKGMYEKAKEEMRLSERILAELPGFRGYKEKELRRESDKLIRNHLYQRLSEARKDLKEIFQKLSDSRLHEVLTDMDRFIMRFDRVSERINHASYGYAGFFNIVKVEEAKLDRMIDFDTELMDDVDKIVEETTTFKKEVMKQKFEKVNEHIENLGDMLEELEETFNGREEVIMGAK
jgi:predicted translin family RNA/ssDNA-binding protein